MSDIQKAKASALGLLARREHSAKELADKLKHKGYAEAAIEEVIRFCQSVQLQSDLRYTSSRIRSRVAQGYGPERIRYELRQQDISVEQIQAAMVDESIDWIQCARRVLQKKYPRIEGEEGRTSPRDLQKQKQFLHYRGFSSAIIAEVYAGILEGFEDG